jgi:hypothetical protein
MRTIHQLERSTYPRVSPKLRFAVWVSLLVCVNFLFRPDVSAQQPSSASIVGRWRSLETTKGGIGQACEFRSDGTADFSLGAVVEMPWRIENNQLILPPATVSGAEQKLALKWLGLNKLHLATGDPGGAELTRVGDRTDAGNPIFGEWLENREMAGRKFEGHWFFYVGGKGLFLMPAVTQHGHYTITDSALHIDMPNTKFTELFELKDSVLILHDPEGGEYRYARY